MKKLYFLTMFLACASAVISCKKKEAKSTLEQDIFNSGEKYFKSEIDKMPLAKIDTFFTYKIDTITQKKQFLYLVSDNSAKIKRLALEGEEDHNKLLLYAKINSSFYETTKAKVDRRLDSMKYYKSVLDKAHDLSKNADSAKLQDYFVQYVFKITNRESNEMYQDTLSVVVDKRSHSITNLNDYLKRLHGLIK